MADRADLTPAGENPDDTQRQQQIVDVLVDAFSVLMQADADAFRTKFRKMAADPFAFYRGSACLFYADMATLEDRWCDERTSRVWIQGDLHAENFGTYMDGAGRIVFDVNDFDEAYLGHVSWDLRRFAASFALLAWRKALGDDVIGDMLGTFLGSYLDQVEAFTRSDDDRSFALLRENTEGAVHDVVLATTARTRLDLLGRLTVVENYERRFADRPRNRRLDDDERAVVLAAIDRYRETVHPPRRRRDVAYDVKDVVGTGGFGIGSAGLPAYNVLLEGYDQALENDVVLSVKQGNVAAPSRIVRDPEIRAYFEHEGHRTAVSQRALQANASQFLGHTEIDGVGFVVAELSPYEVDLDWDDLTEPDEISPVLAQLGRATAKLHCVGDADSDHTLVPFQTEEAISTMIGGRRDEFIADLVDFAHGYAQRTREDHRLFVDAFRAGQIPGISSSGAHPIR
ncbi:DUF2252 domain-containing protein [Modestobacter versicolor]|uniref:DUF2252 domain-containing protein n=1 Tax=Modestobacter versicolor TaxID=429133 RepID=A0A323V376_9ACTN|nr:DUF2252 domain-containing protein [Modestobacter versicolor]MBB3676563.1 uncharacterized protein (DUF2252 family) [Modestobacter versicolor]PZA19279.1 DUF2252 domain-containing protein [Modestobacter versicolor]